MANTYGYVRVSAEELTLMWSRREVTAAAAAEKLGISTMTFYRRFKERKRKIQASKGRLFD